MITTITLNGRKVSADVDADMTLYQFVREHGCYSVKCGCETTNCGLCTVIFNGKPMLSCSILALRANGAKVETLEGIEKEAWEFTQFILKEGADQCGFCNPGFIMNAVCMFREYENPTDEEIFEYMSGNLCRCTGYEGQTRAIKKFLESRKAV